ncbi:uncharacterized protein [Rutidosis leptorrhynchoides]|uniref:uncharacterized protein n=1 Tax=Rutidosis leptorrhynchoides TaxID=125765 RepID=UPI003A99E074
MVLESEFMSSYAANIKFVVLEVLLLFCATLVNETGNGSKTTHVSDLDFGDPLYLHSSDTSITALISMKLKGIENYNVWSRAILLALQTKNKTGFIDSTVTKNTTDNVLALQWDRCNSVVLSWILNSDHNDLIKLMQFLMGLDECYHAVWSNILTREKLPSVQTTFSIVSREESHRDSSTIRGVGKSQQCYEIVGYPPGWINKLMSLINDTSGSVHANVADSGASQHMTGSLKNMKNVFDVSSLGMTVGNPNGTQAKITKIGDSILNENILLSNVLVVPGYCVNLLSVHQLSKNKRIFVSFNDSKCFIQDLLEKKIVGTGSLSCGLLRHPAKPVLDLLKNDLDWKSEPETTICDTCHKGPYRITSRDGYKYFLTIVDDFTRAIWVYLLKSKTDVFESFETFTNLLENQFAPSPYDEERVNLDDEGSGSDHSNHESTSSGGSDTTSPLEETSSSPEGNPYDPEPVFNPPENINEEGRSKRSRVFPTKLKDFVVESNINHPQNNSVKFKCKYPLNNYVCYNNLSPTTLSFISTLDKSTEPTSYHEASQHQCWNDAMNDEMEALNQNNTWVLSELPIGRKPIGSKWIYKIKYKANGEVERYKARLVAKGYNQREDIDYEETYSHVAKMVIVRCILTMAVNNNWTLFQLDINNAFLYGDLVEDVYMTLPEGYFSKDDTRVCKLTKFLYGLKQAPRQWNEKLTSFLVEYGFAQSANDYSLYTWTAGTDFISLLVYVDDMIITGSKPMATPLEPNSVLNSDETKDDKKLNDISQYQRLIGKLIYLTLIKPDISYSIQCLSQYMHCPLQSHTKAAFRVLRYLKGNPGAGVQIIRNAGTYNIYAYSDADWGKYLESRSSVSGYCLYLCGSLISWKSKKQPTVSRSSTESEYRSLAAATSEILWVVKLLADLKVNNLLPVKLFCDNKSALLLAANPVFHERSKYFEIDVHLVREKKLGRSYQN